jgi:hypothetical protein
VEDEAVIAKLVSATVKANTVLVGILGKIKIVELSVSPE